MHKRDWNPLFSEYDLRAVLDLQLSKVSDDVIKIPRERFENESDELLAAKVASELALSPLELMEDDISVSSRDVKVDVSQDPMRLIWDRSQPFYVDAVEVTYHVPFRGEAQLLRHRPSTFTLNPPRALIGSDELQFPYDQPNRDIAATKQSFLQELNTLKQWIGWVNEQVNTYNNSLETSVRQRVVQRRSELTQATNDLASLGFKVLASESTSFPVTKSTIPDEARQAARTSKRKHARRTYDVALSFAGEDRDYVERVAAKLQALGVSVFYDRFKQVNLWGKDLAEHLGQVYGRDSRFVVLFASRSYAVKAWPTHEKQFALSRHLSDGKHRMLPVRFDDTEIPGLPSTIGYLDLRVLDPEKLAELIRQKVDSDDNDA